MICDASTCVFSVTVKLIESVFDYYRMIIICFINSKVSLL